MRAIALENCRKEPSVAKSFVPMISQAVPVRVARLKSIGNSGACSQTDRARPGIFEVRQAATLMGPAAGATAGNPSRFKYLVLKGGGILRCVLSVLRLNL